MKELKYLNKYFIKYKYRLVFGIIFIIIGNFFAILPAVIVRSAFDILERSYDVFTLFEGFALQKQTLTIFISSIVLLTILILVSALLRGVFLFFTRQTIIVMSRYIEYDLKNEIYEHYQSLPLSFYRKNNTGDLMARISEDVSKVRMYIGPALMYGINLLSLFLMVIPYMISINLNLTLYTLIPLPVLFLTIYLVSAFFDKQSGRIQRSLSELSTFVQEAFSGIRVIKAFVRENSMALLFDKKSKEYKSKSIKLAFVQALFMPLITAMIGLSVILTVYVGSTEVFKDNISTGNIAEFIIYINMLTWPAISLGWVTSIIQRAAASQRRINEFLNMKTHISSEKNLSVEVRGDLELKNVSFFYNDSGIEALKNVSFKVNQGESIAIVGTTGSGKSTIANLICRLYNVSQGQILVDNRSIEEYNPSFLRSQIGYVPQDIFLFSDTIENNIAFGLSNINQKKIQEASKNADLVENISRFPNGFQTRVGERGISLSGGQKQRVSIARAIIRDPKLLILDDALSAVDTKTENTILNCMKRIMQNRTSIIISHRLSSAKLANKIIVMDEGKIVEKGTHEELINKNGAYKNLYDQQHSENENF